jgi:hypothetical protein
MVVCSGLPVLGCGRLVGHPLPSMKGPRHGGTNDAGRLMVSHQPLPDASDNIRAGTQLFETANVPSSIGRVSNEAGKGAPMKKPAAYPQRSGNGLSVMEGY